MDEPPAFPTPTTPAGTQIVASARGGPGIAQILLLAVGAALYLAIQVWWLHDRRHHNDFKHIYLGVQALFDGDSPYPAQSLLLAASRSGMAGVSLNPFVYLPFTGLALGFLKPLAFPAAAEVWFLVSHLCIVASAWIMAGALFASVRVGAFGALLGALALFHPLTRSLTAGQLNPVLLLCYSGAFALCRTGRDAAAGTLLGFAAMFKLAPGIFGLHFLLTRRWRALAAMVLTVALLGILSIAVFGWSVHADFLPMLRQMGYGRSTWQEHGATFWKDPANQGFNALFTHLLVGGNGFAAAWLDGTQAVANAATIAAVAVLLALYAWAAFGEGGHSCPPSESRCEGGCDDGLPITITSTSTSTKGTIAADATFMLAVVVSLLVPSLMWDHYLVQAALPCAWLIAWEWNARRRSALILTALCWVAMALPWPFSAEAFRSGAGVPLMSMKLLPLLVLFGQLLAAARPPPSKPLRSAVSG